MTEAEVAKLIYVIKAEYPGAFQKYSDEDYKNRISVWQNVLGGYTYEQASAGLNIYLATDTRGFPPSVGQIVDCIYKLLPDFPNEMEAWHLVMGAVRSGSTAEAFNKLPAVVRRAVRTPSRLKAWGAMDFKSLNTIEQSNFMRVYRGEVEREKLNRKIPEGIRPALEDLKAVERKNLIEDKHEKGEVPNEAIQELIEKLMGDDYGTGDL